MCNLWFFDILLALMFNKYMNMYDTEKTSKNVLNFNDICYLECVMFYPVNNFSD
jgi:hypothetical protein